MVANLPAIKTAARVESAPKPAETTEMVEAAESWWSADI